MTAFSRALPLWFWLALALTAGSLALPRLGPLGWEPSVMSQLRVATDGAQNLGAFPRIPADLDPASSRTLIIPPGQIRSLMRLEVPCLPSMVPGIRGHFETTGTARLFAHWSSDPAGFVQVRQSGLNMEIWPRAFARPGSGVTTVSLILLATRTSQSPLHQAEIVGTDLEALRAHGAGAWPLPRGHGADALLLFLLLTWPFLAEAAIRPWLAAHHREQLRLLFLLAGCLLALGMGGATFERAEGASLPGGAAKLGLLGGLGLVVAALGLVLSFRVPWQRWPLFLCLIWLAALLIPTAWIRWEWLVDLQRTPLQADGQGYVDIARWMTNPWDGLYREPMFPALLRAVFEIVAPGPLQARWVSFVFGVVLGGVLLWAVRCMAPAWVAVVIAGLYASHALLAHSASQALREELVPLLWLSALVAAHVALRRGGLTRWAWMGLLGAALMLTRINTLTILLPLGLVGATILVFMRQIRQALALGLGLGLALGLLAPNLLAMKQRHGDAMHASTKHATWYRNAEFAGQPGHISREEFLRNGYAGIQVTWGEYLFGMHSLMDLTTGTLQGLVGFTVGKPARDSLFRFSWERPVHTEYWTVPLPAHPPRLWEMGLMVLTSLGWLRALLFPRVHLVVRGAAWSLLLFLLPLAPLQGWNLLPDRLVFTCMPLFLLLLADMITTLVQFLGRRARSSRLDPIRPSASGMNP